MNLVLSAILRHVWLMEPRAVESFLPQVASLLEGKSIVLSEGNNKKILVIAGAAYAPQTNIDGNITIGSAYSRAPKGSVALIPVNGPIMKNDYCGSIGTATMGALIDEAENNPNIDAIVLSIDSPGGTVDGTEVFANKIRAAKKPVIAFVDDMAASAAMWIASSCDEIIASTGNDTVGSIGTMTSFADQRKRMEDMGIKLHEIYASKSVDKNKAYRDAQNGDYTVIRQQLDSINETFTSAIKANRKGKYDLRSEDILTGKTYLAKEGLTNGLVDSIGSIEDAISRAKELATANKPSTINTNQNNETMKFKGAWKAIGAFMASAFKIEAKDGETEITAEHIEKMNEEIANAATLKTSLDSVTAEKLQAVNDLAAANVTIATLTTEKTALADKVALLEKEPAQRPVIAAADKDVEPQSWIDPNADHNKGADQMLKNKQ